ncbi:hypothetical protein NQD34_015820 [Periophthalmus magnuspinnatus]|nr:hypothetical protein NQD34_015820 [Periophthalmus magnuspinnatus]
MSDGTQSPCRQDTKNKTTGRIRHNRKNQTQQEKSDTTGKIRHNRKNQTQQEKSDNIRNRPGEGEEDQTRRRRAGRGGGEPGKEEVQLSLGHLKEIHSTGGVGQGTTCE